jgi:hypothetical protein
MSVDVILTVFFNYKIKTNYLYYTTNFGANLKFNIYYYLVQIENYFENTNNNLW